MDTTSILLVDDDRHYCELVRRILDDQPYVLHCRHCVATGLEFARNSSVDLVVLDVMMPGHDGFSLLEALREFCQTPVLMLSARGDPLDRVAGLRQGADDYLAKPAHPEELRARIAALLRRRVHNPDHGNDRSRWLWDASRREFRWDGNRITLTSSEYLLAACLTANAGSPVTRDELSRHALGRRWRPFDRSIDTLVSSLRRKLARAGVTLRIDAIRGRGYVMIPP